MNACVKNMLNIFSGSTSKRVVTKRSNLNVCYLCLSLPRIDFQAQFYIVLDKIMQENRMFRNFVIIIQMQILQ